MVDQRDPIDNLVPTILGTRPASAEPRPAAALKLERGQLQRGESELNLFRESTLEQLDPMDSLMPAVIGGGCDLSKLLLTTPTALSPPSRSPHRDGSSPLQRTLLMASIASSVSSPEQQQAMEQNAQREVNDLRRRLQDIVNKDMSPSRYQSSAVAAAHIPNQGTSGEASAEKLDIGSDGRVTNSLPATGPTAAETDSDPFLPLGACDAIEVSQQAASSSELDGEQRDLQTRISQEGHISPDAVPESKGHTDDNDTDGERTYSQIPQGTQQGNQQGNQKIEEMSAGISVREAVLVALAALVGYLVLPSVLVSKPLR